MKTKILLFFALLVHFAAKSQTEGTSIPKFGQKKYDIGYIGIKNGLANNAVTSVYKDKRGLMWFGTYDGVSRYDGYNFLSFRNEPNDSNSLANNRIVSICGTQNEIWIGTKGGISVYNYLSNQFSTKNYINEKTSKSEKIDFVVNQIRDYKSKMYIATAGKGLLYAAGENENIVQIPLLVKGKLKWDFHVQELDFDASGKLWCSVAGVGLVAMESGTNRLSAVFESSVGSGCILFDKYSNIWMATEEGLLKYNTKNKTHHLYTNQEIQYPISDLMFKGFSNELWIATNGNGIVKYNYNKDSFTLLSASLDGEKLNSNAVSSLYLDNENRVWIGTLRGGVNTIEETKSPFVTISKNELTKNTLPSDFILSLCEQDSENLWIGTDGAGASLWNRKTNTFTNYSYNANNPNSLSNNFVSVILKDDKGTWFGTYGGGVCLFNSQTHNFKKYNLLNPKNAAIQKNIWVMFKCKKNILWAASPDEEGLYRYNERSDHFDFVDAQIRGIISIAQDKNHLWIGNFSKMYRFDPNTMQRKEIDVKYPVRSIVSHSDTKMLVGTEGGGLMIFNPKTFEKKFLTQRNGLPNNSILNIVRDKQGAYWCSTYNGIFVYNVETGKITSYHDTDGLQSNQFNYNAALRLSAGEIVFGGIKGFNIIDTKVNSQVHAFPKLIITSIKVNNKIYDQDGLGAFGVEKLKLPYDESMLNIDFAALEYSLPEKISYAYFLEGWDSQWHYVDNIRSANYSRITEGDYVLKIKSTNAEGIWNSKSISLPITILPPWYRSNWAYFFYFVVFGFVVFVVDNYQREQARLKYEVRLSQDLAKQEKELNEKKLTFFTNISHEFRSPLTMIINPLKDIIYGTEQQIDPAAIEMVYSNSRRLLSLVDQLLLFRKTETETGKLKVGQIDIVELCKEVFSCFVQHAKSKKIDYSFSISEERQLVYVDREKIEMALFNLISNALKFTEKENGKVAVNLRCTDSEVIINVTDNGEGVDDADKDKIFNLFYQSGKNVKNNRKGFGIGLYLVKQFIAQHHGKVSCRNNEYGGSVFEIRLLLGKEHFGDIEIREDLSDRTLFLDEALEETAIRENVLQKIEEEPENVKDVIKDAKSILVVDDNVQIRNYLKRILASKYHITTAENAENALQIVKNVQPDLIISDVVMGEMNGVAFCKHIKSDPDLKHIPVILLTGGTSEDVKLKGAEVGADDYITKPFDNEYLLARINGILTRRDSEQNYLLNSVTKNVAGPKLSDEDKKLLDKIIEIIDSNLDVDDFNIKDLASELGMSHSLVYKKIKKITGKSVLEFTRNVRLRKVATLLITTDLQISQAASIAGFGDIKYFRKHFQQFYNLNPSEFKKKYQNVKDNKYILNESFWKST
ncbi:hybrid sensor histidine kinase/response regulator transcription factor [Flavobacterium denitrificans]|uniref:hybrid sensor histidine kinase/response regulator transcription factor n=1 Tax=Flavobacterium denitrificans TaxID=281361 RepID=UPI0003FFD23C|nr:two-component regulator propeller domain-containing protein [Flavobacterium denitrificans]